MYKHLLDRIAREISQIKYILDIYLLSGTLIDTCVIFVDYLYNSGTYCTVAKHCNVNHFPLISFSNAFSICPNS